MIGELQGVLLNDAAMWMARGVAVVMAGWWAWRSRAEILSAFQRRG